MIGAAMKAVALGAVFLVVGSLAAAGHAATPMTKRPPAVVVAGTAGTVVAINPRTGRAVAPRRARSCAEVLAPLAPTLPARPVPMLNCRMILLQSVAAARAQALRQTALAARLAQLAGVTALHIEVRQLNAEVKALQSEVRRLRAQLAQH